MRIFLAFLPNIVILNQVESIKNKLKEHCESGNYTEKNNLHVTLIFIGDVNEVQLRNVKKILHQTAFAPFSIKLKAIKSFETKGKGDVFFIDVFKTSILEDIYKFLFEKLNNSGFNIQNREYLPHLTLGRKVVLNKPDDLVLLNSSFKGLSFQTNRISLMESVRIDDELIYREIDQAELK
ncbi:MAG: RNA 2',3'-cyclic phosphodiesterase [Firmicutes bacterium]|nr:RNA 2',3'-cyclic phosphodiesterase [Bacillota bacterium]